MKNEDKTKEQLIKELAISQTQRKRAEEALRQRTYSLGERVKELNCLYGFATLAEKHDISLEEVFQGIVDLIPPAWQYPEVTCARIILENQEFRTNNFKETIWKQASDIVVHGDRIGTLEVCYLEQKPGMDEGSFLKEERSLIKAIAEQLANTTERKRAEQALRESQERFRALTESTSDWVWEVDADGVYTYASPKVRDLLGYEPEEVIGKTPFDLMPPEEAKRIAEEFRVIVESQRPFAGLENANLHKDGRLVVLETSGVPVFSADGQVCGYRGIDRDITKRKRAEEALQASEQKLRLAFESIVEGIGVTDLNGNFTQVNEAAVHLHGYENKEEMIGRSAFETIAEKDRDKAMEQMKRTLEVGSIKDVEYTFVRKDGSQSDAELSTAVLRDASGNPIGIVGIISDIAQRRRMEEEVRRSRDYLEKLNDSLAEMIFTVKYPERVIEYANHSVEAIFGYKLKECLGQTTEFLYPDKKGYLDFGRKIKNTLKLGKDVLHTEHLLKRKNGEVFPTEITTTFLKEDGEVKRVISVVRDVAERKQAEEALQESQRNFRNSLDNSPLGVRIVTAEGEFLYANQAILDIYGYRSIKELKTMPPKERYTPQSYAEHQERKERRKLGKPVPPNYEIDIVRKDGEVRHLAVLRKEVIWDGETQFQALYQDITERRRAEEALRRSEERFRNIYEESPIGIELYDSNGRLLNVNKACLDIFGVSDVRDIEGFKLFEDPNLPDEAKERLRKRKVARYELPFDFERVKEHKLYSTSKSGVIHIDVLITPLGLREKGPLAGYLVQVQDITERKRAERKIVEYEELSELKSNLLSTVSHELRTPLATIKGYSTMLLDYDRRLSRDEKRDYLGSVDKATDRLTELVDHLLDMSRLEAGLLKLEKTPASISNLIKGAVTEAGLRAPKHKIVLNLPKRLPRVNIDAKRIRQVLDNIIDNAIKYSSEGTKVAVSAKRVGRELLVSIADQGIGIPAEDLERVFDPMYRIEQRLTWDKGGVGLGLAICKGLVDAHGGHIWMESEEGKGSTCSFTLSL